MTRHATLPTSLGGLLAVGEGPALVGLYFPGHWYPPSDVGVEVDARTDPLFALAAAQLGEYLDGRRTGFDVPVATSGDPFQERVWRMLRDLRHGETTTYGALAERLGDRGLARRVGQAVGRNPVSILIPCHRVVGASGSLTGYAGGLERKRFLLELEGAEVVSQPRLFSI
ncbi:methylated-DNA--[protein]-cysteine S-methyltransferase [Agromyces sp. H66]|uniref:methylated-DNA--[protein]-cysteine S-methyltransferase n=1 Tax=Agromyces sp. H66 TaxID=2529859 RepID=UPI0010AA832F|nr:methylated-DNA--[protein]-cysteine S-methyltransferase [Agromyces sp. H66]